MFSLFRKDKKALLTLLIFAGFFIWWVLIHFGHRDNHHHILDWFAGTYGVIALLGGIWGILISRKWGGFGSVIGRAIMMFSIGLLFQEFGQLVYAYYAIVKVIEVPYPSLGDVGFFGSVFFYIYGAMLLAKAGGAKFSLQRAGSKIVTLALPLALLVASYLYFLRHYQFDWHHPLTILLDFGYPLGEAGYLAAALLAFLLSRKLLGGVMRNKILLLILALLAQYAADFNFLYQASRGTWTTAAYGDFLYAIAYTIMTLALLNISSSLIVGSPSKGKASDGAEN